MSAVHEFQASVITGTIAAGLAGASELMQFRYTGTGVAVVKLIQSTTQGTGTAFAAGGGQLALRVARSWSVDGSGGGLTTLTGNNAKLRSQYNTTNAAIRIATTAALTAGTKTTDANPFALQQVNIGTGTNTQPFPPVNLYSIGPTDSLMDNDMGLMLVANEGFAIEATVPATGTWSAAFTVKWAEFDAGIL